MSTRTKIIEHAMQNFAEHGYSGGSLAQIAEEVGIRKQSIYTYFKSKDALYETIVDDAMQAEIHFFEQSMTAGPPNEVLQPLLKEAMQRFSENGSTKFFIRAIFMTPPHLEEQISARTYHYLDSLETIFTAYFEQQVIGVSAQIAATSLLALLDSLYVEILYGGTARFEKRFEAGWHVFTRGITRGEER